MNWFKQMWTNPNVHVALGTASGIAATLFPQYALALAGLSAVFGVHAIVTPETPAPALPVAGSLHTQDYLHALLPQLGAPSVPLPATGSLHGVDYVAIANALVNAFQNAGVLKPAAEPAKPA
jgi:hypothetical protein